MGRKSELEVMEDLGEGGERGLDEGFVGDLEGGELMTREELIPLLFDNGDFVVAGFDGLVVIGDGWLGGLFAGVVPNAGGFGAIEGDGLTETILPNEANEMKIGEGMLENC